MQASASPSPRPEPPVARPGRPWFRALNRSRSGTPPDGVALAATERKVRAGFATALACLVVVGLFSLRAVATLREDAGRVAHTRTAIGAIERIFSENTDAQNGHRGYAVTGDESYLEPYFRAVRTLPGYLRQVRILTEDNPGQQQRLATLSSLVDEQLRIGRDVIEARRQRGYEGARELMLTRQGKRIHDQIRGLVAAMKEAEEILLAGRETRAARSAALTRIVIVGGSTLAFGFVGLALLAIRRDFGGRRQAEDALRRSEEDLAVTLHSIGDAVLATDPAGNITRMNRVAEQLTGWTLAEAAGRPIARVFHIINEETRAAAPIPVDDVLATGKIHGLANHTVLVARDGTERAIADSAAPIRDSGGQVSGVVLVFRDVTAERAADLRLSRALDELARERARLRFIFDSVPVGISFTSVEPDGNRLRLINDAHLRICGVTREQVDDPATYVRITHADDREIQAHLTRQVDAGIIDRYSLDKRYLQPDGRVTWVQLSFLRQSHPDGRRDNLIIVVDITERRKAQEQMQRNNAHLRALFESLPGLYLVLTPDLTIVTATDSYLKATLSRREAIVGRGLFEVFPDNTSDPTATGASNLRTSLDRVRQSRTSDTMAIQRYDLRRSDGTFEERFWSPINSPMLGADGRIEYIIHRVEDVTDFVRKKPAGEAASDATMRARLEQMEAEVFQSSQAVQTAHQQLHAAYAELESFSYSVSHDLRAPLRHIQGYIGLLNREGDAQLSEKGRRYVKTIADAAREMGQLIDDLLAFSKMGRSELRETSVDLAAQAEELRRNFEFTDRGRNIRWTVAPLPRVQGDAGMLKQVLANVLGNAVKYTRGREPAEITLGTAGEEDGRLVLFVRDNGAGFDMKYADKLFGVFQRLHRAEEFEGTGIGLATVRRIITRHGGRTWAQSAPDAGATFFFTLRPATPLPPGPGKTP